MYWTECSKPENQTPERALALALRAINCAHRAFGAPGDFGYDTREGRALQTLYALAGPVQAALKQLSPSLMEETSKAIEADNAEPRLPSAL